jgi:hypothetical protein
LAGLAGMFMNKNSRRHATFGKLYYWFILLAFVTVIILAILRWPHNNHLLLIGAMTTLFCPYRKKTCSRQTIQMGKMAYDSYGRFLHPAFDRILR